MEMYSARRNQQGNCDEVEIVSGHFCFVLSIVVEFLQ